MDKKTTSSWQMDASEVETVVDKDCSLDLNPNPTHPRGPNESMESDDSREETKSEDKIAPGYDAEYLSWEAKQIQQGILAAYAKQGSNCEECQQIIEDKSFRHYPHLCERCFLFTWDIA